MQCLRLWLGNFVDVTKSWSRGGDVATLHPPAEEHGRESDKEKTKVGDKNRELALIWLHSSEFVAASSSTPLQSRHPLPPFPLCSLVWSGSWFVPLRCHLQPDLPSRIYRSSLMTEEWVCRGWPSSLHSFMTHDSIATSPVSNLSNVLYFQDMQ